MPGAPMKVSVEVSVATMQAVIAHHGTVRPARKYCWTERPRRPIQVPKAVIATT